MNQITQPFAGFRVLDLTHVLAGPYCAYQLAVLGAETIKIEPPGEPDIVRSRGSDPALNAIGMGTNYLTQNSNKRSIVLDLKTEGGAGVLKRLARSADVLVENYRAGAMDTLGLGYADLSAINPRLVYCSLTGYGQTGPKAAHTAYDNVIQAASGLMSIIGTPEVNPLKVGAPVIDYASGLTGAFAISSALLQREKTGRGCHVDVSMLATALTLMSTSLTAFFYNGAEPSPTGNKMKEPGICCYPTKDGLLMMGAFNRRQHERLWLFFGRPDLAELSSWEAMEANCERLQSELQSILSERTAEEWEEIFSTIPIPAARVRTLAETLGMEQVKESTLLQTHEAVDGAERPVTVPVAAFTLSEGSPSISQPPPRMGQDTDSVLSEAGYNTDEIARLRLEGVIA